MNYTDIIIRPLLSEKIKISSISKKSNDDIQKLVDDKFKDKKNANYQIYIARVLRSALNYDRDLFDTTLYSGFTNFGLYDFYFNIMYPSLQRIGEIWSVKSNVVEHENFVADLLESKINDITKEIQSLPLSCIEVDDDPVGKIPELKTS